MKSRAMMIMAAIMVGSITLSSWAENKMDNSARSNTNEVRKADADNTARNVRDRDEMSLTPVSQGNNEADLSMTRRIRESIMDSKDLSMNAKNVKVITNNGKVTLRGPVKSEDEKRTITEIAEQVAQKANVNNQLEVVKDKEGETRKE